MRAVWHLADFKDMLADYPAKTLHGQFDFMIPEDLRHSKAVEEDVYYNEWIWSGGNSV